MNAAINTFETANVALAIAFEAIKGAIKRNRKRTAHTLIQTGRKALQKAGIEIGPCGAGNVKTALPATYREVGATCPLACQFHPDHYDKPGLSPCYALHGNVNLHQQVAGEDALKSASTALLAMSARQAEIAHARNICETRRDFVKRVGNERVGARLHVSGDFVKDGVVDVDYIELLCEAADMVRKHFNVKGCVAYTYTHLPAAEFEVWRLLLKAHGIEVTYSKDDPKPEVLSGGSAVVWRHAQLDELKALAPAWLNVVPCPAQKRDDWTCSRCTLCSVGNSKTVVAFDPHGVKADAISH